MATTLLDSDFYLVERVDARGLIRVTRKVRPFLSEAEVELAFNPLQRVLDTEGRERCVLLVDTRVVAGRNDPASEAMFAKHRRATLVGFKRVAMLVQTPVGMLHVQRLMVQDRSDAKVFSDEAEAIAYLTR